MKQIIRFRWVMIVLWLGLSAALTIFTPDLQQLVAEKGQITVPKDYRSNEASDLLQEMSDEDVPLHDLVLVFHREQGLSETDRDQIVQVIDALERSKNDLEISSILDFTEDEEIEESTVSEDGTTILVPIEAKTEHQTIEDLRGEILEKAGTVDVPHALTGESLIEEDIIINSEEGLTKTIYITVALILIILLVVFRSLVAPFIPLITVGISYLVAEGVVSILADTTNFPLSTFTQVFMVAIMFGIGTDYCILVISRFKEEMNHHESMKDAVIATYKGSGKTIFYAALAVLIGFATIGLSKFTLYQSAVAVAIGVLVITFALFTIVPFFLMVLGKKLFWPFHQKAEHKESKLWGALGHFTWTRSAISLAIIAVIVLPALFFYKGDQSYDNLAELSDDYETVKAFNWIEESFGPGEIMPVTVVMKLNKAIEDVDDFQDIETITEAIDNLRGISKVRSATRPAGEIIEDFLLESQTDLLTEGFEDMLEGVNELQDGLQEAAEELKNQAPELDDAQRGAEQLMDGTREIRDGIEEIQHYLQEIEEGILEGSLGAGEIERGLRTIKENLDTTIYGHQQILEGYQQLAEGLKQVPDMFDAEIDFDIEEIMEGLNALEQSIDGMHYIAIERDPTLQEDPNYLEAYGQAKYIIEEIRNGLIEAGEELQDLENIEEIFTKEVIAPIEQLNKGYEETIAGQIQLSEGLEDLIEGATQLKDGLSEAAAGQGEIVDNMAPAKEGLMEIYGGQEELKDAFKELQDGLLELGDGLEEGSEGLAELYDGLDEVNRYLSEMDLSNQPEIVVIPEDALDEEDFWDAADLYLSKDRTIVKFEAILDLHPYSKEALMLVDDVEDEVNHALGKTNLAMDTFAIGGISSMNNDLNDVSAADYQRTATLMLIGIFLILVVMLRSLIMPIYILASLLLTYFTSLGFTEFIFVRLVGYDGITWAVPFFTFVMLIALGVDYSIFLMNRFNEYDRHLIYEGMMKTMRNMGTVIISATIILGGTFAAMLPAGVLSLLQIATAVIIGLALYALVILPLFTPICVRLFGKYNWWPFMKRK